MKEKPGLIGGTKGTLLSGSEITVDNYSIVYSNPVNGLIFYQFKKNVKVPVPALQPQEERRKIANKQPAVIEKYVYVSDDYLSGEEKVELILAALLVASGTVIEDVVTVGGGVANDAPSFMLALELLKQAFAY